MSVYEQTTSTVLRDAQESVAGMVAREITRARLRLADAEGRERSSWVLYEQTKLGLLDALRAELVTQLGAEFVERVERDPANDA